jgi:hypothetical protein
MTDTITFQTIDHSSWITLYTFFYEKTDDISSIS